MSEFVIDDWKLKARTVVKLYRRNTNTLVCHSWWRTNGSFYFLDQSFA